MAGMVMAVAREVPAAAVAVAEQLHKLRQAMLAELRLTLQLPAVAAVAADPGAPQVTVGAAHKQRLMHKEVTTLERLRYRARLLAPLAVAGRTAEVTASQLRLRRGVRREQ